MLEPEGAWSLANLLSDHGEAGLARYRDAPIPSSARAPIRGPRKARRTPGGADLVIVHEWNDPELVAAVGRLRARGGRFTLLFHDTHHRAVTAPHEMRAYDLTRYDGVLAFGETLARRLSSAGAGAIASWSGTKPPTRGCSIRRRDEGERDGPGLDRQLGRRRAHARTRRLPACARARGAACRSTSTACAIRTRRRRRWPQFGARYHGWLANAAAPEVFARHLATVHVPRRFYTQVLPGIPTIRVFEALACGIPLVSAPWDDCEHLFRVGEDFLMVARWRRDDARICAT